MRAQRAKQSAECPRWDSNPCWSGFKPLASAIWATGANHPMAAVILMLPARLR